MKSDIFNSFYEDEFGPTTLHDRGPYPPDQVAKELDGSFSFVVYDSTVGTVLLVSGPVVGVLFRLARSEGLLQLLGQATFKSFPDSSVWW
ncbi:transmembrane protein, putative [Medicago truncatula]|uniref:Transmembrane protein, putative n=1 Tax=Medicago truncatula TaxID=3880 RepID=A0A072TZA7_MEDTR|nr:transmembrane protein, putative [Medicago truncatula]